MPSLYGKDNRLDPYAPRGILIGLAAEKQSGKDTFADYLAEKEGWTKLSFARPMKQSAAAALGVTVELLESLKENRLARVQLVELWSESDSNSIVEVHSDISVREYLQKVGTEAHREIAEFGDRVWVDMLNDQVEKPGRYIVTDARFENEQREIKALGGYVIQINRPGLPGGDGHRSESVDHGLADYTIDNDGSLSDFYWKIRDVLRDIRATRYGSAVR